MLPNVPAEPRPIPRSPELQSADRFSRRAAWAQGQPISELMRLALARPELISLAAGFVDQESLPVEPTRQALDALLADLALSRAALQYGTTAGYAPLREMLLEQLRDADGHPASQGALSIDQVVMTAGSNELLHLVGDTLLDPGDIVLTGAPTYFVFLGTLANLGARAIGVALDADGMIPAALDEAFARCEAAGELDRVKAVYITTYFDNPSTVTLSAERRPEILEIVRRWSGRRRIYVIEDAAYRELRYQGDDVPSLRSFDEAGDRVILAQTFSKAFSPGIRVGWGVLPPVLVEPLMCQKGNADFGAPNFNQYLMAKVLELDLFRPHVARLRQAYRVKLEAMLQAAAEHLGPLPGVDWLRPSGGLYIWLRLPEGIDTGTTGRLFDLALEQGTLYVPGHYCYPRDSQPIVRNQIRLSFGVQSPARIREGIAALGRAVRQAIDG